MQQYTQKAKNKLAQLLVSLREGVARTNRRYPILKYLIVVVGAIAFVLFDSTRPFSEYLRLGERESYLIEEIEYYEPKIKADSLKLEQIEKLGTSVERIAREEYLMKAPDEEIFIVVDKETAKEQER